MSSGKWAQFNRCYLEKLWQWIGEGMMGFLIYSIGGYSGSHYKDTIPKFWNKFSQKRNCAASVPISIFICLWAIYIFPQSVCLLCCRKICGLILGIYKSLTGKWMRKLGQRPRNFFSGNTEMGFSLQCTRCLTAFQTRIYRVKNPPHIAITCMLYKKM